jgi:hypothetical protein
MLIHNSIIDMIHMAGVRRKERDIFDDFEKKEK